MPDPSGQVVFTPDPNTTSERIELTYTVSDDFGATDEGTVIVSVRLEDANNEPDARNDAGVTVVGKPIRLDVLAERHRPRQRPVVRRPAADPRAPHRPHDRLARPVADARRRAVLQPRHRRHVRLQLLATDGEETDVAQIRIEVGAGGREPTRPSPSATTS